MQSNPKVSPTKCFVLKNVKTFYQWHKLKNLVYYRKPIVLTGILKHIETEATSEAIPKSILKSVAEAVAHCIEKYVDTSDHQFEQN